MKLRTGIDLIEIDRLRCTLKRHGERFLKRIFTPLELDECGGQVESLAARYAAKEAVAKALGYGIGVVSWQDIEIRRGENGEPTLYLYGTASHLAEEQGLAIWSVSLSHTANQALAMVVVMG